MFDGLLDPAVCVRERGLDGCVSALFTDEMAAVASAGEKRRREFAGGRACAREAIAALGLPPAAIPSGADRAPVWPVGIVGSISHTLDRCVAAVARKSDGILSLGVDLEEATPLEEDLAVDICTASESRWLARQPVAQRGLLLKVLFSTKECAYKCQYPLTRTLLEFDALSIELDVTAGSFSARFETDVASFTSGSRMAGRFRLAEGHIATAMVLR